MINRILMEMYDEYSCNNIKPLEEFSSYTFTDNEVSKLFICCTLIMFSCANGLKPRYECTRENLLSIVLIAKEEYHHINILKLYVTKINRVKGISKYFNNNISNRELEKKC